MRYLLYVELALGATLLLAVLVSGLSSRLRDLLDLQQSASVALYFLILMAGCGLVSAPLTFLRGYVLPRRYGLSRQSRRAWLADEAKEIALGLALGTGLVVVVYVFLRSFPETWWLLAFAFLTMVVVVMSKLAPVLILPLFFKLEPLTDQDLRQRLLKLAERCGARVRDVFQIGFSGKTSAANAMLMGWGGTRRIALSDTLLQDYSPEEIEVIMAHELGHQRHRDIARLIIVQAALMLLGFFLVDLLLRWAVSGLGFSDISDVAALPLLILGLAAFALVVAPLSNFYARRIEEAADRYALAATDNPEAFTSMLTRLTDQNLNESRPGKFAELMFYDHPPYYKRVELARCYRREEPQ